MLDYLSSLELRHLIQAATNKSELFNKYAQWVAFGESGLESEGVRDEQRKLIKYNHLAANLGAWTSCPPKAGPPMGRPWRG
jgi:TnpA family transposase